MRPKSAYSAAAASYSNSGMGSSHSVKKQSGRNDFNMYENVTSKRRLEIMELQRRSKVINDRIRDLNRENQSRSPPRKIN